MVLVVLIGFPLVAMYYMNKGVRYRKALFAQLDDLGEFRARPDSTEGQVLAIFFLDKESADREALTQMHHQFDNRQDVIFYVDGDYALVDSSQMLPLTDADQLAVTTALGLPYSALKGSGFLVDRKGHLRKRYDLSNKDDVQLFVRQIALFLPPKKTPKPKLQRETEK